MITTTGARGQGAEIVSCSCLGLEGRADKRVLLLTASPPLPEETWQFGQAPKVGGRTCFGMGEALTRIVLAPSRAAQRVASALSSTTSAPSGCTPASAKRRA